MRNIPLKTNQTFYLNNHQEKDLPDPQVKELIEKELNSRPIKVKRIERDTTGCISQIHLDLG